MSDRRNFLKTALAFVAAPFVLPRNASAVVAAPKILPKDEWGIFDDNVQTMSFDKVEVHGYDYKTGRRIVSAFTFQPIHLASEDKITFTVNFHGIPSVAPVDPAFGA